MTDPLLLPWRTGRKLVRTVFAIVGTEASDDDVLLGLMDTDLLAAEVVAAHNQRLRERGLLR